MPWAQEVLERPCTRVALDEIRFILRGRPAAFPTQLGTSYIHVGRVQHDGLLARPVAASQPRVYRAWIQAGSFSPPCEGVAKGCPCRFATSLAKGATFAALPKSST